MSYRTKLLILALAATILAGCETIPPEQRAQTCAATDWQPFGENDGRLGVATSDRASQFEDCAQLGQPMDLAAYQAGRATGLTTFCTAENGYDFGYDGRRYEGVCPAELEADFLQGYEQGRRERPVVVSPGFGIGAGSGGVRTRVGIGIGLFSGRYDPWNHWSW